MRLILGFFLMNIFFIYNQSLSLAEDWLEEKGKHFIVQYAIKGNRESSQKLLKGAEEYYRTIADDLGFSRYDRFWTWDERAKITVYPDQETFMQDTGQPLWSKGGAIARDLDFKRTRTILTYRQEEGFLDGVLPHEISHLILKDFFGIDRGIPLWLEEGIAQLKEAGKKEGAAVIMRKLIATHQHIPLNVLLNLDVRFVPDPQLVKTFYAESVSIVHFLLTEHGQQKFTALCSNLRDGHIWEEAVKNAYPNSMETTADLEQKWIEYLKK